MSEINEQDELICKLSNSLSLAIKERDIWCEKSLNAEGKVFDLQKENADLRAKLEELQSAMIFISKNNDAVVKEIDNLEAQVALLSRALILAREDLATWIEDHYSCDCSTCTETIPTIDEAISATPQQAAERVQGLVMAAQEIFTERDNIAKDPMKYHKTGTYFGIRKELLDCLEDALAKYRGNG